MVRGKKTMAPPSEIKNGKEGSSSFLGKSFQNRRKGLMKKVYELATLCDTDASIICYGPDGRLWTWPENNEQVEAVIQRFKKKRNPDFSDLNLDPSSSYDHGNENKKTTREFDFNLEPSSSSFESSDDDGAEEKKKKKKKRRFDVNLDPSWVVDADANKGLEFDYSVWDNRLEKSPLESLRNLKCELDSKSEELIECQKRKIDEQPVHQNLPNLNSKGGASTSNLVIDDDDEQVLFPWDSLANFEMMFDDQETVSPLEFGQAGISDFDEDYDVLNEQDIASILNDAGTLRMCTFESIASQAPPIGKLVL